MSSMKARNMANNTQFEPVSVCEILICIETKLQRMVELTDSFTEKQHI